MIVMLVNGPELLAGAETSELLRFDRSGEDDASAYVVVSGMWSRGGLEVEPSSPPTLSAWVDVRLIGMGLAPRGRGEGAS